MTRGLSSAESPPGMRSAARRGRWTPPPTRQRHDAWSAPPPPPPAHRPGDRAYVPCAGARPLLPQQRPDDVGVVVGPYPLVRIGLARAPRRAAGEVADVLVALGRDHHVGREDVFVVVRRRALVCGCPGF